MKFFARCTSAGVVAVCGAQVCGTQCNCLYNRGSAQMQALCVCIEDLFDLLSPWLNCAQPYLTCAARLIHLSKRVIVQI